MSKIAVTLETIKKYKEKLANEFGKHEVLAYPQVSQTQLSIARHYGGMAINGRRFVYQPADDSLIRAEVVNYLQKLIRDEAKRNAEKAKAEFESKQGELVWTGELL